MGLLVVLLTHFALPGLVGHPALTAGQWAISLHRLRIRLSLGFASFSRHETSLYTLCRSLYTVSFYDAKSLLHSVIFSSWPMFIEYGFCEAMLIDVLVRLGVGKLFQGAWIPWAPWCSKELISEVISVGPE